MIREVEVSKKQSISRESVPDIHGDVLFDEPMSGRTSFKIGGPADVFAVVQDVPDLQALLKWLESNGLPVFVLGAGSNLLVSDKGIRGAVIQLGRGFQRVRTRVSEVHAGAGVKLARTVRESISRGLAGLECLSGIPGTVGGAIYMNAGTPQGCVKDCLDSVTALDRGGNLRHLGADDLGLEYRRSNVREQGLIIAGATFRLTRKDPAEINEIVAALMYRRKMAQPPGIGTAGSVFKNPKDGYAGQLLEEAGAKGMQVGGARVSSKHANFIYNTGEATAAEVRELMNLMQKVVQERFGVRLEPEIELVGEW